MTLYFIIFGSIIFGALLSKVPNNTYGFMLMIITPLIVFSVWFLGPEYLSPDKSEYIGTSMAGVGVLLATLLSIIVSFISLCCFAWFRSYLKSKRKQDY